MRGCLCAAAVVVAFAAGSPADLSAQLDLSSRIAVRAGVVAPGGSLYSITQTGTRNWDRTRSEARLEDGLVLGLEWVLRSERLGVAVRTAVDRSVALDARLVGVGLEEVPGGNLPLRRDFSFAISSSVTGLSTEVLFPLRLRVGGFAPYVSAGVGLTRYDFEDPGERDTGDFAFPGDGTVASILLGGGFDVPVGDRRYGIVVQDEMSRYADETQHSLRFLISFPLMPSG